MGSYWVHTLNIKPGKASKVAKWWRDSGKELFEEGILGSKSVKAYLFQSEQGQRGLEIWNELDEDDTPDGWGENEVGLRGEMTGDLMVNVAQIILLRRLRYGAQPSEGVLGEMLELFETGPARLLADWSEPRTDWLEPQLGAGE